MVLWVDRVAIHRVETDREKILRVALNLGILNRQQTDSTKDSIEKRKIAQEELSAKLQVRGCDITRSALAKIEVGQRHIYPDEIRHFKEILNVEYDDLFNV